MKKLLLSTSAIALAGAIAIPASAAEWTMTVSGSMEQQLGYGDSDNDNIDGDFNGIDAKSSTEIHFSPSIMLDNGIKIGARVELEGETAGDQIDETYVYMQGAFGLINLGADDSVASTMAYGAPDVTFYGINSGDDENYLPFSKAFGTTGTFVGVAGDAQGIRYFTPRMAGFQAGFSYQRDAAQDDNEQKDEDGFTDDPFNIYGVGANYTNSFGDVSIAISGVYTTGTVNEAKDPEAWAAGLVIGFGAISVGASFSEYNNNNDEMETWEIGAAYETGPWGVSINYLHGETDDGTFDADIDKFLIGVDYELAGGVRLGAWGSYVESDSDDAGAESNGDGFVLGTGILVSF